MQVTIKNKERVLNQFDFLKSRDEDSICKLLTDKIQNGDFEFANKVLQYGWNVRQCIMNSHHIYSLRKFGFFDFSLDENGWIPNPKWLNKEEVELFGWGNGFIIGQGMNGKWTYGYNAMHNLGGVYCGLNEYLEPLSKHEAINQAINKIIDFHSKAIKEKFLEEAAKNTSRKVLAIIKKYQQPKQAVLF